jgi:spermidine synthase
MPALLVLCFVLSGGTSLVLQVVWVRQLIDVFGSSTLAISTVLATFMAGLALGAWLGGRLADRVAARADGRKLAGDPLAYYAACEAIVGVCALAIPIVVANYRGANAWLWLQLGDTPVLLALARFALSASLLLIPTTCMGATLPLLSRRVTRNPADLGALGRRVGILYAANTGGAVVGASAAGFWMIPWLGVTRTNAIAAAIALGLAAAIVAVLLARARASPAPDEDTGPVPSLDEAVTESAPPPVRLADAERRLVVIAFGVSGAVAMSLEVLWSRALALIIGSSIYSFTLVLVVFLVGIAAGAWLVTRLAARTVDPIKVLGVLFAGVAASIVFTHTLADDLPGIFVALIETTDLEPSTVLSIHTFLIGLLILPTSLCLGAVMPLVIRAYAGSLDDVGRDVGRAYAFNTVGAIAGAFAGGFVVLPVIGLEWGVRGAAIVDALLAMVLIARSPWPRRRIVVGIAGAVVLASVALPPWDKSALTAGVFRVHVAKRYVDAGGLFERPVVFYADGIATTVSVEIGKGPILKNNGKVEASTVHDMPTQVLLGLLPVLMHGGDAQDVFVIGYGSGISVGAVTQSPAPARIDVVELEPEVYVAADRFFSDHNHRPQDDPRVHRYVGDGRNFLLAGDRRYDVIISEPSNPWIAGVASLFTREFYAFAKQHLADGGVYCQWAQLYELGPRNVKMIYRTFAEAFPYVYAFTPEAHSSDTFLIGSMQPLSLDVAALRAAAADPTVRAELDRAEVRHVEDLIANLILGPDELASFTAGADVNTDDNALLEYSAPRDLMNAAKKRLALASTIFGEGWPYGHLDGIVTGLAPGGDGELALARALLEHGRRREAITWWHRAREGGAGAAELDALAAVISLTRRRTFDDPELPIASADDPMPLPGPELFAADGDAAALRLTDVYGLVAAGRWDDAWASARELPARADDDGGRDVTLLMGYVAFKALAFPSARTLLKPLARDDAYTRRRPAAVYYAGRVAYGMGKFRDGVDLLLRFGVGWPEVAAGLVE